MTRVNYPMKLSELIVEAQKALRKYGDKYVLLSDDEEGNGLHECYYTFADNASEYGTELYDLNMEDCIVLG